MEKNWGLELPLTDSELEHLRATNLGRLLDEVHLLFDRRALNYLREAGYPMINSAHSHVLRTMRMEGARITDMAEQAGISKQAMSKLVAAFSDYGFVEWQDDPKDGRSRIVHATEAGRTLLACGVQALRRAEQDITDLIKQDGLEHLRQLLLDVREASGTSEMNTVGGYRRRRA